MAPNTASDPTDRKFSALVKIQTGTLPYEKARFHGRGIQPQIKAEAMAAYARQAKDSELIQYATEIKVRAERRCGELLAVTEKNTGGRPADNRSNDATGSTPTLAQMGLSKDESSRYQQLAAMPAEHFETAVATAKATAGEVTTAFMLRVAVRQR